MKKSLLAFVSVVMLMGAGCSFVSKTPDVIDIRPREIVSEYASDEQERYRTEIDKPRTGIAVIDTKIDGIIDREQQAFLQSIDGLALPEGFWYEFRVGYDLVTFSDRINSIVLHLYQYTGGAHGLPYTITMTFDFETGEEWSLDDVFLPDSAYLETLSTLVATDLLSRDDDMMGDEMWVREGVAPQEQNFSRFALVPEGIRFYFDVYQVAPYAAGPQETIIPFTSVTELLRDEFSAQ